MSHEPPVWARRLYHALLLWYPASVRRRFGAEMLQLFSEDWRRRKRAGGRLVPLRMFARAIRDVALNGWNARFTGWRRERSPRNVLGFWGWCESILRDIRVAVRALARAPVFSTVVITTFMLGVGVNAAIFSVVDGVLFRPLPFPESERLTRIWGSSVEDGDRFMASTFAEVSAITVSNQSFSAVAAYSMVPARLLDPHSTPENIELARLTGDLPSIMGATVLVGRGFSRDDFRGDGRVVLLSHELWQRRYAEDPDIIGETIRLRDDDLTVIGVLPPTFEYPITSDAWRPFPVGAYQDDDRELEMVARLTDGVSSLQATSDVQAILSGLRAQGADPEEVQSAWVQPLHAMVTRTVRTPLLVLLGSVAMVLLICCVNVANLFLARALSRRSELAMRMALGASRSRLMQSLMMEGLVLGGLGGLLGLGIGKVLLEGIIRWSPPYTPRLAEVTLDLRVVAVIASVSIGAGLLSTLLPAVRFARTGSGHSVRTHVRGRGISDDKPSIQNALVVMEIGLSTALVFAAALFIGTFVNLINFDKGFQSERLLSVPISSGEDHGTVQEVRDFYQQIAERVRSLPGVSNVALTFRSPLQPLSFRVPVSIDVPVTTEPPSSQSRVFLRSVSPSYFDAVQIPITRGRVFRESDDVNGPRVAIVNESFVREHFEDRDPLGRNIYDPEGAMQIVGVAGDVRPTVDAVAAPALYRPFAQEPIPFNYLIVKTAGNPENLIGSIRAVVWSVDPNVALDEMMTIDQALAESVAAPRFLMVLIAGFAGLALCLAGVGIYGVMSYAVTRRTRELGVRQALGASRGLILGHILRHGMSLTAIGVAAGLGVASLAQRFIQALLYEVQATSFVTLGSVVVTLGAVSLIACLLPAVRATRIAPILALRD